MVRLHAAIVITGNEILSGKTLDMNTQTIALELGKVGIRVNEVRVIADDKSTIINTVREMSSKYDYVFTTGGIGPTHDDITATCVAEACGVKCKSHPEIYTKLKKYYKKTNQEFTEARAKMACIPEGAKPLQPTSTIAPGFNINNIFVMAGIPYIMKEMLKAAIPMLKKGDIIKTKTLDITLGEGVISAGFAELQERYPEVEMGSYPFSDKKTGASLVLRSFDETQLNAAYTELQALIKRLSAA